MDPALARCRDRVAAGRDLAEPRADAPAARRRSGSARGRPRGCRSRPCPRYRAWSLGMTSPRRQAAITGTWSSSANRTRSLEQRARRTPAPARITGRSADGEQVQHRADVGDRGRLGVRADDRDRDALGQGQVQDVLGQGEERRARAGPRRWPGRRPRASPRRSRGRRSRPPTWPAAPIVLTRSTSWNASRPRTERSTWPTRANIGVESAVAVWMPMARFEAPTARVPRHAAGRPVSWP